MKKSNNQQKKAINKRYYHKIKYIWRFFSRFVRQSIKEYIFSLRTPDFFFFYSATPEGLEIFHYSGLIACSTKLYNFIGISRINTRVTLFHEFPSAEALDKIWGEAFGVENFWIGIIFFFKFKFRVK